MRKPLAPTGIDVEKQVAAAKSGSPRRNVRVAYDAKRHHPTTASTAPRITRIVHTNVD